MNQPDPAEIERITANIEEWKDYGNEGTYRADVVDYGKTDIAILRDFRTLLAALATAEEQAEKLASQLAVEQALCADNERQRDEAVVSAAAAEAVVEAAEAIGYRACDRIPEMAALSDEEWKAAECGICPPCKLNIALANYHKATGPREDEG